MRVSSVQFHAVYLIVREPVGRRLVRSTGGAFPLIWAVARVQGKSPGTGEKSSPPTEERALVLRTEAINLCLHEL
jgi:hypothetical protein